MPRRRAGGAKKDMRDSTVVFPYLSPNAADAAEPAVVPMLLSLTSIMFKVCTPQPPLPHFSILIPQPFPARRSILCCLETNGLLLALYTLYFGGLICLTLLTSSGPITLLHGHASQSFRPVRVAANAAVVLCCWSVMREPRR